MSHQDARVLQDEFTPLEVQRRDTEVNELTNALGSITHGRSGDTVFLFRSSGAEKPRIARFAVERRREEAAAGSSGTWPAPIRTVW